MDIQRHIGSTLFLVCLIASGAATWGNVETQLLAELPDNNLDNPGWEEVIDNSRKRIPASTTTPKRPGPGITMLDLYNTLYGSGTNPWLYPNSTEYKQYIQSIQKLIQDPKTPTPIKQKANHHEMIWETRK